MATTALNKATQSDVRNASRGLLFTAIFGAAWGLEAANALNGWESPWPLIFIAAIGMFLITRAMALRRAAAVLPVDENVDRANRRTRWFRTIFVLEVAFIVAGVTICNATGHPELGIPVAVAIVGLHFFPMAPLFGMRGFYSTGALLCLLAVLTVLLLPSRTTFESVRIHAWWAVAGFGAAVILWGTGIRSWMRGKELLGQAQTA